jgi:hypothetical protein
MSLVEFIGTGIWYILPLACANTTIVLVLSMEGSRIVLVLGMYVEEWY